MDILTGRGWRIGSPAQAAMMGEGEVDWWGGVREAGSVGGARRRPFGYGTLLSCVHGPQEAGWSR